MAENLKDNLNLEKSNFGWGVRAGFGVCVGLVTTGLLWLMVRNAWVGVFVMGVCLGAGMIEKWGLVEETRGLRYDLEERERDVLGLRVRMAGMINMSEVEYKRARLREVSSGLSKSASF